MEEQKKYKKKFKKKEYPKKSAYDMYDDKGYDLKKPKQNKYSAQSYVIYLLARRDYSVKELQQKLKEKEYPLEESEQAIEWAINSKYQSDERYASGRTRYRSETYGNRRIKMELEDKGIQTDIIEQVMEEIETEEERASKLMLDYNRRKNLNGEWDLKVKEKAFRYFISKGFSYDSIKSAWRKVFIEKDFYN